MKSFFSSLIVLLFASSICLANPFLVCDPQKGVTDYHIAGLASDVISIPAVDDGNGTGHLEYDLKGLVVGSYDCNVTAYNSLWNLESPPAPFHFSKTNMESPVAIQIIVK